MNAIHLALASDANPDYLLGLTVAAGSALTRLSRDVRPVVHLLDLEIPDAAFAEVATCLSALRPDLDLCRHRLRKADFTGLSTWNGSLATWARLRLPALVEADWCVYADCDVLFTDDPARLLALADGTCLIQGQHNPPECTACRVEYDWFRERGLPVSPERYVCAGFLLMNLAAFRREGLEAKCVEFLRAYPDVFMADQATLNHVCHGRTGLLPPEWGFFSKHNPDPFHMPAGAIHFAGDAPWSLLRDPARPGSAAHREWLRAARAIVRPDSLLAAHIPDETAFLLRKWLPLRFWRSLPRWAAVPPWARTAKSRAKRLWRRRGEPMPLEFL